MFGAGACQGCPPIAFVTPNTTPPTRARVKLGEVLPAHA